MIRNSRGSYCIPSSLPTYRWERNLSNEKTNNLIDKIEIHQVVYMFGFLVCVNN